MLKVHKEVPSSSSSAYNLPNSTACPGMPAAQQELQIHVTLGTKLTRIGRYSGCQTVCTNPNKY